MSFTREHYFFPPILIFGSACWHGQVDVGAEWVEIFTAKGSKKITYEYGKESKEAKSFISDLRKQFDTLGECD